MPRKIALVLFCILWVKIFVAQENDSLLSNLDDKTATNLLVYLDNPDETDRALKQIHQFRNLQSIVFEGEAEESVLKKIIFRMSVLKNLTDIHFRDNDLKKIPDNIIELKGLKNITVESNKDLDYDHLFELLRHTPVTGVQLINNDLKAIPAHLDEFQGLSKLKITGSTQIDYEKLIDQLTKNSSLRELAIPVNFITDLPKNIVELKSLQVLDVSNNVLTELPENSSSLTGLNNLNIQGNIILNQLKELEKFKGADIRYLSLDKGISGEEIEVIKKMFPNVELNFPADIEEEKPPIENISNTTTNKPRKKGTLTLNHDPEILSEAYLSYPIIYRSLIYNFDTLTFNERYADVRYAGVYRKITANIAASGRFSLDYVTYYKGLKKKYKHPTFYLYPHRQTANHFYRDYPELNAFSGCFWIYQGELSKRQFVKQVVKKKWNDIRIAYNSNNSLFDIELKADTGFVRFPAYPLSHSNQDMLANQRLYSRRYSNYQKALLRRSEAFEREFKKSKQRYEKDFSKLKQIAWTQLQARMSDKEKLMDEEEWLEYYDHIISLEKKALNNTPLQIGLLTRAITIRGYSNIASISPSYGVQKVEAYFINSNGSGQLPVTKIYIVDRNNKTFYVQEGSLGLMPETLWLKQYAKLSLLVILRNGDWGIVAAEDIDKSNFALNKTLSLPVRIFDKNLDTIGKVLEKINLE